MARKTMLDVEKLVSELIRVLHEEDIIGTQQVIEMFENAGGDETQALELIESDGESEIGFDVDDDDMDMDDDDDDF